MVSRNRHNKKKVVLVVDDDRGIQDLTKDILELYGHTVLTAGQDEALRVCEERGKDLSVVLLDVMESETNAFDVFRRILDINPAAQIIITSGDAHDGDSRGMFGPGSAGFLKKPYRMTELLRMVEGFPAIGRTSGPENVSHSPM